MNCLGLRSLFVFLLGPVYLGYG